MNIARVIGAAAVVIGVCGLVWLSKTRVEPGEPAAVSSSLQPVTNEPATPTPRVAEQPVMKQSPAPAPADDQPDEPKPQGHPMELENIPPPGAMGLIRERKERFQGESQTQTSPTREAQLRAAIEPVAPPGLLDEVLCRRTVCRVRMEWKADRAIALLSVLSELRSQFDPELGVDEPGALEPNQTRRVDVYLQLPGTAQ